jgi:hypothetical protein
VLAALVFLAVAVSPLYFGAWRIEVGGFRLLSVATARKPLSIALLFLVTAGALHPAVRTAWRRRSPLVFYALAALAMWVFSLGPAPTLMGKPFIYKAPYAWLMTLPGVDGVRVPARFWMLAALCLAVAAGLALRHVMSRWPRLAAALPALAGIGLLSDAWPVRIAMWQPPELRPVHTRAVARLELPAESTNDVFALYRATEHRRPLFNGYSGYFAPHYWVMQHLLEQRDPAVLTRLSAFGAIEITVDSNQAGSGGLRQFVADHPQAELVYENDRYTAFRIRRGEHVSSLPRVEGERLPIASIAAEANAAMVERMIDGDLSSRWHAGREQRPGDSMTVDLGTVRDVNGVEMTIGTYVTDFPRLLAISTSVDGGQWSPAWDGRTGAVAFFAALEDPLNVTLPFVFERRQARYLRFVQNGSDPVYYWTVVELRVIGK